MEELRELEFHFKVQGDESLEELGMMLQALGLAIYTTLVPLSE